MRVFSSKFIAFVAVFTSLTNALPTLDRRPSPEQSKDADAGELFCLKDCISTQELCLLTGFSLNTCKSRFDKCHQGCHLQKGGVIERRRFEREYNGGGYIGAEEEDEDDVEEEEEGEAVEGGLFAPADENENKEHKLVKRDNTGLQKGPEMSKDPNAFAPAVPDQSTGPVQLPQPTSTTPCGGTRCLPYYHRRPGQSGVRVIPARPFPTGEAAARPEPGIPALPVGAATPGPVIDGASSESGTAPIGAPVSKVPPV